MKRTVFPLISLMLTLLSLPPSMVLATHSFRQYGAETFRGGFTSEDGVRLLHPVYVRLQALEGGSVIFWESLPQSFQDHVGTIELSLLATFVSSNALNLSLHRDAVGNLWAAVNYTFKEGDYIGTLTWVSSRTISENLTIPDFIPFPESFPDDVKPFLSPGRKMPVDNDAIKEISAEYKTQNMVETTRRILDFASEGQDYDREKVELLMDGGLKTASIMDFLKDSIEVLGTGKSFCFERSLLVATVLRAAGVPARTYTDATLKTWVQVWLPGCGWVDAEVLSVRPPPMFPRPLFSSIPWMVQNSSDATFPFFWLPRIPMRVANLTFSNVEAFVIDEYRTILSEPIGAEAFEEEPDKLSFPVAFKPEMVYTAITQDGPEFSLTVMKGKERASKKLVLNEPNEVTLGDVALSFKPVTHDVFLALHDFTLRRMWVFDARLLIPAVGVPVALILWLSWKRTRRKPPP